MQKWEYMSAWVDHNWEVRTVVGYEQEDFSLPKFVEFLNIVGLVGWELVALVPVQVGHRAFFKRPSD
jgi:hypothetical protein